MAESIHEKLNRLSKRRRGCHAGYDDLINEFIDEIDSEKAPALNELPFIVGVMGDFSGNNPTQELKPLAERKFIRIDRDNFNAVMEKMTPGLKFRVENTLAGNNTEMAVELAFKSMDDFEPARLINQIEPLKKLTETRNQLRDLMTTEEETTTLEDIQENGWKQSEKSLQLASELGFDMNQGQGKPQEETHSISSRLGQIQAEVQEILQTKEAPDESLLDQAITATQKIQPDRTTDLSDNLVKEALKGTVSWDKNVTVSITDAIKDIDARISKQLAAVMHHPEFLRLEGAWRGLNYLVMNSETGENLKIQVLNLSKKSLLKDFEKSSEFDQTEIYKKIYVDELQIPGGAPYGALIGDYEFTNHPDDMTLLQGMSQVSAAAFAPFISAAAPNLFGFDSWTELTKPGDLAKIFDGVEYTKWKSFRDTEESRFVVLTMPRTLARLPYGSPTQPLEELSYEEAPLGEIRDQDGKIIGQYRTEQPHDHYCWMNTAYLLAGRLTDAFAKYGWCTAIRGEEGGGKVENLPSGYFISVNGIPEVQGPTEAGIDDRRQFELSNLGFLPILNYKNTDFAVFFGSQTTQKPKKYDRDAANANAVISARLPYVFVSSRFAHYLKIVAKSLMAGGVAIDADKLEYRLNSWIHNYVLPGGAAPTVTLKNRYPLREAKIVVQPAPGNPNSYHAILWFRPWLPMEDLSAALRVVVPLD